MLLLPFRAKGVVMLVLVVCLLDVTAAYAATVAKIDKSRTKIMLTLTKDEMTRLKVGDRIAIKDETGEIKATGSIVKIKKSQATLHLDGVDVESRLKVEVVAEVVSGIALSSRSLAFLTPRSSPVTGRLGSTTQCSTPTASCIVSP